jgi:hypothetical protein
MLLLPKAFLSVEIRHPQCFAQRPQLLARILKQVIHRHFEDGETKSPKPVIVPDELAPPGVDIPSPLPC